MLGSAAVATPAQNALSTADGVQSARIIKVENQPKREMLTPPREKGSTGSMGNVQCGEPVLSFGGVTTRKLNRPSAARWYVLPRELRTASTEVARENFVEHARYGPSHSLHHGGAIAVTLTPRTLGG